MFISDTLASRSTMGSGDFIQQYKKKMIEKYKSEYGSDWKSKLKEQYGGQLDESTKK